MAIPNLLKDGRNTGRPREARQKEQDGDHLRLNKRQVSEVTSPRHLTLYYVRDQNASTLWMWTEIRLHRSKSAPSGEVQ